MIVRKPKAHSRTIVIVFIIAITVCNIIVPSSYAESFRLYSVVLSLSLLFVTLADIVKSEDIHNTFLIIGLLVMGTMMAFRAQTGIDDWVYERLFYNAGGKNLFTYVGESTNEIGYVVLNWFLYYLTGGNYDLAQAIITFIPFVFWARAIKSYRGYISYPVFALFLWTHYYFLIMAAALIRIYIAIPIVLYSFHFVVEGKWKKYIVWVLIASLFHMSALAMLILILFAIDEKLFYKNWFMFALILAIVVPIAFFLVAKILVPVLGARYAGYGNIGQLKLSLENFDTLPILLIGAYFLPKIDKEQKKIYVIALVLLSLSLIFSVFSSIASFGRLIYYSNLGMLLIVSAICKNKPKSILDQFIILVLIGYGFFYMMYTSVFNNYYAIRLFPYHSIWS